MFFQSIKYDALGFGRPPAHARAPAQRPRRSLFVFKFWLVPVLACRTRRTRRFTLQVLVLGVGAIMGRRSLRPRSEGQRVGVTPTLCIVLGVTTTTTAQVAVVTLGRALLALLLVLALALPLRLRLTLRFYATTSCSPVVAELRTLALTCNSKRIASQCVHAVLFNAPTPTWCGASPYLNTLVGARLFTV